MRGCCLWMTLDEQKSNVWRWWLSPSSFCECVWMRREKRARGQKKLWQQNVWKACWWMVVKKKDDDDGSGGNWRWRRWNIDWQDDDLDSWRTHTDRAGRQTGRRGREKQIGAEERKKSTSEWHTRTAGSRRFRMDSTKETNEQTNVCVWEIWSQSGSGSKMTRNPAARRTQAEKSRTSTKNDRKLERKMSKKTSRARAMLPLARAHTDCRGPTGCQTAGSSSWAGVVVAIA